MTFWWMFTFLKVNILIIITIYMHEIQTDGLSFVECKLKLIYYTVH